MAQRRERVSITPIPVSRRVMFAIVAMVLVALAWIVYRAPTVAVVAIGGAAVAVILSYPVRLLSRLMPRKLAILATFLILIGAVSLGIFFLIPLVVEQVGQLAKVAPEIVFNARHFFNDRLQPLYRNSPLSQMLPKNLSSGITSNLVGRIQGIAEGLLGSITGFASGLFSAAVTLFGILFVAVYLLIDVRKVKAVYLKLVPRGYRRDARELWEAFGVSLSRYLGGLLFTVAIEGFLAGIAMWMIGIPYPVALGVWISITAIIPYVGAVIGAIPAVVLAFLQSPTKFFLVCLSYAIIQQLDSHILTPRIQGQALRVHPIIVLLAVLAGAEIGGFLGVIFTVPILAVLRVLFDFFWLRLKLDEEEVEETEERVKP